MRQWSAALIWAAIIWVLSTQWFSDSHTATWIYPCLRWLEPGIGPDALEATHYAIRKSAHFIEYFIFALLLYRAMRAPETRWNVRRGVISLAIAACYAGLDEAHQLFVPGRSASVWDSLLDSTGALVAILVCWLWFRFKAAPLNAEAPSQTAEYPAARRPVHDQDSSTV